MVLFAYHESITSIILESGTNMRDKVVIQRALLQALTSVIDPELGVDIVSLGLIYGIAIDAAGTCQLTMTLTMMGCPLQDTLQRDITQALEQVPEVKKIDIKVVWDPMWTPDRMSRAAKFALGLH